MTKIYRIFYLQGRDEIMHSNLKLEIDLDPVIDQVLEGAEMHKATLDLATAALLPSANKKKFVKDNKNEIAACGGDEAIAFTQFELGRIDQLRARLEEEVVEGMEESLEGDDDEEEDDEEDEDEDDDGKAGGDGEDEDDEEEEEEEGDEEDEDDEDDEKDVVVRRS